MSNRIWEESEMNKWLVAVDELANSNTARLVWVLLIIVSLVMASGAPLAFGTGGGVGP
jgi:hypothetical protein